MGFNEYIKYLYVSLLRNSCHFSCFTLHGSLIFYNLQLITSDSFYIGYSTTNQKYLEKGEIEMHGAIFCDPTSMYHTSLIF